MHLILAFTADLSYGDLILVHAPAASKKWCHGPFIVIEHRGDWAVLMDHKGVFQFNFTQRDMIEIMSAFEMTL